jgi:hypothetical protein
MLQRLTQLSSDSSPEGRSELLRAVTDLFLLDAAPSEAIQAHYTDIAHRSLDAMVNSDRADYAERVATQATLPQTVALRLAGDEDLAIAGLVLKLSPVLKDSDLAAIAVTHSQRHLVAIAERARLSATVTDVPVVRGDDTVLRTVSGDEGADFSDHGMDRLIERGGDDPEISRNLVQRANQLPAAQAERVLAITTAAVSESSGNGSSALTRDARARRLEVRLMIADLRQNKCPLDDAVMLLADEDRAYDLVQVISAMAEIGTNEVLRALLQPDSSGIAVLCRSLGLGHAAFAKVLKLRAARLNMAPADIERDVASYANLHESLSARAMRLLRVRTRVQ